MPVTFDIDVNISKNAGGAIKRAQRKRLEDAMTRGWDEAQERVPEDRGTLRMSLYEPTWTQDGSIRYGATADHAAPMEFGTKAYWPPTEPLLDWAERVLGDRSAGYAVQAKIAEEGIDAQPYLRPSADAVKRYLDSRSFGDYLDSEL